MLTAKFCMQDAGVSPLLRSQATILQLNIGLFCNQACTHCHVESSPKRTEMMDRATAVRCIELLKASPSITTLDITGGAPELNSQFEYLVEAASQLDVEIIDRCNLTVLVEPGKEKLAQFLADHKVWQSTAFHSMVLYDVTVNLGTLPVPCAVPTFQFSMRIAQQCCKYPP